MKAKTRDLAAAAEERITGRKFCTSHQGAAEIAGGMMHDTKYASRWVCASCAKRSKYKLREPDEIESMQNVITSDTAKPRVIDVFTRPAWKPPVVLMRDGSNDYKHWPSKGGD